MNPSSSPPINQRRTLIVDQFFLLVSVILMITGHYFVIISGKTFDEKNNEHYNLLTRWVSDFAAVYPEGLWIKASIAVFCIAIFRFFNRLLQGSSHSPSLNAGSKPSHIGEAKKAVWLLLAAGMIVGLIFVILFDAPAPKYKKFEWFFGLISGFDEVPRSSKQWVQKWHHDFGFHLFVVSFAIAIILFEIRGFLRGLKRGWAETLLFFALLGTMLFWLFTQVYLLPGIPQRVLLMLFFYWLWRNFRLLNETTTLPTR